MVDVADIMARVVIQVVFEEMCRIPDVFHHTQMMLMYILIDT